MSEIEYFPPQESFTGYVKTPCLTFGNGVEIEKVVFAKTTQESMRKTAYGLKRFILPKIIGKNVTGTDVVKVHFLPSTSSGERVNEPELVPNDETRKIQRDAMIGFLSLAQALKKDQVQIQEQNGDDYYLYADTNERFAAFLRRRCGFRGTLGGEEVWIKKSEFISDENIQLMIQYFRQIESTIK